jgi:hypothetical protein
MSSFSVPTGYMARSLHNPSFISASHLAETSYDFKLSFKGVDWQKRPVTIRCVVNEILVEFWFIF